MRIIDLDKEECPDTNSSIKSTNNTNTNSNINSSNNIKIIIIIILIYNAHSDRPTGRICGADNNARWHLTIGLSE